jgi:hypothetical protein
VDLTPNADHETYKGWLIQSIEDQQKIKRDKQCNGLHAYVPVAVEMKAATLQEFLKRSSTTNLKPDFDRLGPNILIDTFNISPNSLSNSEDKTIEKSAEKGLLKKMDIIEKMMNGEAKPMHLYFSPAYGYN